MFNEENNDLETLFQDDISETEAEIRQREKQKKIEKLKEIGIKILKIVGTIAVFLLIGYGLLNDAKKNESIENVQGEAEVKKTALKNELVGKYNAIIFADSNYSFSKDLQENTDKNFLIKGMVHDIFKENNKFFIKIEGTGYFGIFEINDDNVKYIIENKNESNILDDFFVVVKINNVSRSLFEMSAERDGEDTYAYNESSDDFLLKGAILDIKKID